MLATEYAANQTYKDEEQCISQYYAAQVATIEGAYDTAVQNAGNDPTQAAYWTQIDQAEQTRTHDLTQADQAYATEENSLYVAYQGGESSYSTSAPGTLFVTGVAAALASYRQTLWDAAHVAQPDLIGDYVGRGVGGTRTIVGLAIDLKALIQRMVPSLPASDPRLATAPVAITPPPSADNFLSHLTADVRAALQVEYSRPADYLNEGRSNPA